MGMRNEVYTRLFAAAAIPALERTLARGNGPVIDAESAADYARAFADVCTENPIFVGGVEAQVEWEVREERLQVAAQMATALVPLMQGHTPWAIADRAAALADALIDRINLD